MDDDTLFSVKIQCTRTVRKVSKVKKAGGDANFPSFNIHRKRETAIKKIKLTLTLTLLLTLTLTLQSTKLEKEKELIKALKIT